MVEPNKQKPRRVSLPRSRCISEGICRSETCRYLCKCFYVNIINSAECECRFGAVSLHFNTSVSFLLCGRSAADDFHYGGAEALTMMCSASRLYEPCSQSPGDLFLSSLSQQVPCFIWIAWLARHYWKAKCALSTRLGTKDLWECSLVLTLVRRCTRVWFETKSKQDFKLTPSSGCCFTG